MTLSNSALQKIQNLATAITNLISVHMNKTGSSSQKGHVQAGGAPQDISITGSSSAGTDNGYYARADHVHKIGNASTSTKGIVQLTNSINSDSQDNAATAYAVKTAYDLANQLQNEKLSISQTSHKGKNVVVDGTTGNITFEDKKHKITADAENTKNLDDYTTEGFYSCQSNSHAKYIFYSPLSNGTDSNGYSSNKAFFLLVENGGNLVKQTLTYYDNNKTYVRTKKESGDHSKWNDWTEVSKDTTYTNGTGLTLTGTSFSLTDASNYVKKSDTSGYIKNDGTVDNTLETRVSNLENELEDLEEDLLA